jgi:CHAT domain-containing protein
MMAATLSIIVVSWAQRGAEQAMAVPLAPAKAISRVSEASSVPFTAAVLRLGFTQAKGKTAAQDTDSFLDILLIPAQSDVIGFRREVSMQRFNKLLRRFYEELASQQSLRTSDSNSPSRQLYSILIEPVNEQLRRLGVTTLLISADSGLQAVPFSALHDGQLFFGERFEFALTPALGLTRLAPRSPSANDQMLAAGASEFQELAPLPLVSQELSQIAKNTFAERYLNKEFTPQLLLDKSGRSQFNRVHVATHAEFLPGGPEASRLYTGVAPISMKQLAELRRKRGADQLDLFVLSACRTALGDAESELGFAGLALQAGARSAIGSLWYVDDIATSAFFVQFYKYLYQGIPKSEALKLTRMNMAAGEIKLLNDQVIDSKGEVLLTGLSKAEQRRVSAGLQHPFFWAGIQMLGSPW